MLNETWLLGRGPGAYAMDFPQHEMVGTNQYVSRPHNLYLQMAHTSGNLSALIYIAALGLFFWASWKKRGQCDRLTAIVAALVGYAVATLVDDSYVGVAPIFWVLWGSGFALLLDDREEE